MKNERYWLVSEDDLANYGDAEGMDKARLNDILRQYPLERYQRIIKGRFVRVKQIALLDDEE